MLGKAACFTRSSRPGGKCTTADGVAHRGLPWLASEESSCSEPAPVVEESPPSDLPVASSPGGAQAALSNASISASSSSFSLEAVEFEQEFMTNGSQSSAALADTFGVARPSRIMVCLVFFRDLISPSGHRWQCPHSTPFLQPLLFQNHAQGRQEPSV